MRSEICTYPEKYRELKLKYVALGRTGYLIDVVAPNDPIKIFSDLLQSLRQVGMSLTL